ncbi:MAG: hypothetical protein CL607_09260 [Anaerolineaceae bacterium]|nr:hypothetical protein [Anaerolineaceae bacterium]
MKREIVVGLSLVVGLVIGLFGIHRPIYAQDTPSIEGLWVVDIGSSNGWLFRDDGTGIVIRSGATTPFTYEVIGNYLVQTFEDQLPSVTLYKITVIDELLILENVSNGFSLALISADANEINSANINEQDFLGDWFSWGDMATYSFGQDEVIVSPREDSYAQARTTNYEISGSVFSILPDIQYSVVYFDERHLVTYDNSQLISWTKQDVEEQDINIDNLYGVWHGVPSNISGGRNVDSNNYNYEFRSDGLLTSGFPSMVASYEINDRTVSFFSSMFGEIDLYISYLDEYVIIIDDVSENPLGIRIVAFKIAPEAESIIIDDNLAGTWFAQYQMITISSDGSTDANVQFEKVGGNVLITNDIGTTVYPIFRLDDYFLILEQGSGEDVSYGVYSRIPD